MSTATFTLDNVSCAGSVSRVSQQLIDVDPGRDVAVQHVGRPGDTPAIASHVVAAIEHAGHSHADLENATKDTRL